MKKNQFSLMTGAALMTLAAGAIAQQQAALEEIVVTAQKRSQSVQDVPIAITAISPSSLKNNRVETTVDLSQVVPSLTYNNFGGFGQPYLRGIGSELTGPNSDSSVATYIDGTYVSNDNAIIQSLLGVERIEVLAGPQGTLYGRNAVGGAINVVTLTPTQETEAKLTATLGDYSRKETSLQFSGGLTDDLAVGVYIGGTQRDSYLTDIRGESPVSYAKQPDEEENWGIRLKAVYSPTDRVDLTGTVERTRSKTFEGAAFRQTATNGIGALYFPESPVILEKYKIMQGFPSYSITDQDAVTLRADVGLDWANFVSISNYRDVVTLGSNDISGSLVPIFYVTSEGTESRQVSQELQLLSLPDSDVEWITGLYYFHEDGGWYANTQNSQLFFPAPIFTFRNFPTVITKSYAAFAQATFPLSPISEDLRLTLGVRYTKDEKELSAYQNFSTLDGVQVGPNIPIPSQSDDWNEFTPKVTLDYRHNDTLYYATFSQGFKAGAYNLPTPTQSAVDPETLDAYEVGVKAQLWDNRINWNTAAYYYDFSDLQVSVLNFAQGGGTPLLENAAEAEVLGLESNITVAATENLTLNLAFNWMDSEYSDYSGFVGTDEETLAAISPLDNSGNELARSPELVVTAGAEYSFMLDTGGEIQASLNWYYNDGYYWNAQNNIAQDSYNLLNATLGYTTPDGRFTATAWGKNLTDEYYAQNQTLFAAIGNFYQDAAPRMVGLTLSYEFQ